MIPLKWNLVINLSGDFSLLELDQFQVSMISIRLKTHSQVVDQTNEPQL